MAEPKPERTYSQQEVARFDEVIRDWGLALHRLFPTLVLHRCPACGQGDIFKNALYLKEKCPYCQVRYERLEGGLIVSMVVNYFFTIVIVLITAILLVRAYGFTDWLLWVLIAECVVLVLLMYQPSKAMYLWFTWVLGFVHIDQAKQKTQEQNALPP